MLAAQERVKGPGGVTKEVIWHKPVGGIVEQFQAIACDEERGITVPSGERNVPLRLDKPGERWCDDCLALIRSRKG